MISIDAILAIELLSGFQPSIEIVGYIIVTSLYGSKWFMSSYPQKYAVQSSVKLFYSMRL